MHGRRSYQLNKDLNLLYKYLDSSEIAFYQKEAHVYQILFPPLPLKALLLRSNIWVHCKRKKTGNSSCLIAYEETPVAAGAVYERAMVANATISAVIRFGRCIT